MIQSGGVGLSGAFTRTWTGFLVITHPGRYDFEFQGTAVPTINGNTVSKGNHHVRLRINNKVVYSTMDCDNTYGATNWDMCTIERYAHDTGSVVLPAGNLPFELEFVTDDNTPSSLDWCYKGPDTYHHNIDAPAVEWDRTHDCMAVPDSKFRLPVQGLVGIYEDGSGLDHSSHRAQIRDHALDFHSGSGFMDSDRFPFRAHAATWAGYIDVRNTGDYTFSIASTMASSLKIDGVRIVDHVGANRFDGERDTRPSFVSGASATNYLNDPVRLVFSEPVRAGTGHFQLVDATGALVETITAKDCFFSGEIVIVPLPATGMTAQTYTFKISENSVEDASGNGVGSSVVDLELDDASATIASTEIVSYGIQSDRQAGSGDSFLIMFSHRLETVTGACSMVHASTGVAISHTVTCSVDALTGGLRVSAAGDVADGSYRVQVATDAAETLQGTQNSGNTPAVSVNVEVRRPISTVNHGELTGIVADELLTVHQAGAAFSFKFDFDVDVVPGDASDLLKVYTDTTKGTFGRDLPSEIALTSAVYSSSVDTACHIQDRSAVCTVDTSSGFTDGNMYVVQVPKNLVRNRFTSTGNSEQVVYRFQYTTNLYDAPAALMITPQGSGIDAELENVISPTTSGFDIRFTHAVNAGGSVTLTGDGLTEDLTTAVSGLMVTASVLDRQLKEGIEYTLKVSGFTRDDNDDNVVVPTVSQAFLVGPVSDDTRSAGIVSSLGAGLHKIEVHYNGIFGAAVARDDALVLTWLGPDTNHLRVAIPPERFFSPHDSRDVRIPKEEVIRQWAPCECCTGAVLVEEKFGEQNFRV